MKIKKGDNIIVTTGKDKGKTGTVLRVLSKDDSVLVEGINVTTKHQKSRKRGQQGQIVERPTPVHVSNVALKNKKTGKPGRVGYVFEGEGDKAKKVRVMRPSGEKV